jgi:hypothetical protein
MSTDSKAIEAERLAVIDELRRLSGAEAAGMFLTVLNRAHDLCFDPGWRGTYTLRGLATQEAYVRDANRADFYLGCIEALAPRVVRFVADQGEDSGTVHVWTATQRDAEFSTSGASSWHRVREIVEHALMLGGAAHGGGGEKDVRHSEDFTSVYWYGTNYTFSKTQAHAVTKLMEAWRNGTPCLKGETLCDNGRLVDVFRRSGKFHPAWGVMIVREKKGVYKLQPKPSGGDGDVRVKTSGKKNHGCNEKTTARPTVRP